MFNRRIHGAITISHSEPHRWNEEDAQTLMTIARIIAVQLEQSLNQTKNSTNSSSPITGIRN